MNRRFFFASLAAPLLVATRSFAAPEIELLETSVHYAPLMTGQLAPGTALQALPRNGRLYVTLDGSIVGRLPLRTPPRNITVARVSRDEHGRLRMMVRVA